MIILYYIHERAVFSTAGARSPVAIKKYRELDICQPANTASMKFVQWRYISPRQNVNS